MPLSTYLHVDIDPRNGRGHRGRARRPPRRGSEACLTRRSAGGRPEADGDRLLGRRLSGLLEVDEPLKLDGSQEAADKAKLWSLGIGRLFGCADSVHNIDRIMRLPGTINVPTKKKRGKGRVPMLATLVEADWSLAYPLSAFEPASPTPPLVPRSDNDNHACEVDVNAELVKLTDVHDLDKFTADGKPIDDRIKRIIQDGFDELDQRPDCKDKTDRSRWVFDVACALVRRDVADNVILSVLLNRNFRISDHIYDRKGNTRKYAARQIGRAKERVALAVAEFEVNGQSGLPLKQSQRNVEIALARMGVSVKLDAFRNRMIASGLEANDMIVDDRIITCLRFETDRLFKFLCPKDFYFDFIGDLAFRNAFHPVREYLDALAWDGTSRLNDWLIRCCGAADNDYVRAVGRIVLLAAVRRVRRPGVKFDEMLVLEGAQGIGKSQVLNALAVKDEWFTDEVPLAGDGKLVIEAMNGRWIAEAAELKGMRNKEVEHLKAFLSRTHDRGRLAYDRITSEVPRQFIIVGTTNSEHYLMDTTGNRRFWPVHVERADVEALTRDRDQLWAEASHREAQGESIRLPEALWAKAAEEQAKRVQEDPFLITLAKFLEGRWGKIASEDVFRLLDIPAGQRNQAHNIRIGETMRRLGWRRERLRREGTLQYCYLNCQTQDAPWLKLIEIGDSFIVEAGSEPTTTTELPF